MDHEKRMQTDPVYACVYASLVQNNCISQHTTFIIVLQDTKRESATHVAETTPHAAETTPPHAAETTPHAAETPPPPPPPPVVRRRWTRHCARRFTAAVKEAASCVVFQLGCFAWMCTETDPIPFWVAGALVIAERRVHLLRRVERAVVALRFTPVSCVYCFAASVVPGWVLPAELTWASALASAD